MPTAVIINKKTFFPVTQLALIVLHLVFFLLPVFSIINFQSLIDMFAFIPSELSKTFAHNPFKALYPLLSSLFIHGNMIHLFVNLSFLFFFGFSLEKKMGHLTYLLFCITSGIGSFIFHYIFFQDGIRPVVGSSGLVAATVGALIVILLKSHSYKSKKLSNLLYSPIFLPMVIWFFLQISGAVSCLVKSNSNVAWATHLGGFFCGCVLSLFLWKPHYKDNLN